MKRRYALLAFLGLFVISCGPTKLPKTVLKNATAKKVIRYHDLSTPHFKTLYAHLRATYDDGKDRQSISLSMRMHKDDTIWISAKLAGLIPLAKMIITPQRVQFYEKIHHQYFDGGFELLSKWLGTPVDFKKVQNLLLGQALYKLKKGNYQLKTSEEGYALTLDEANPIQKFFLLNKHTFRLKKEQLKNNFSQQELTVTYSKYTLINQFYFPKKITVLVTQHKKKTTQININYRSIEINKELTFPFKIPSGYKEIQLR